LGNRRGDRELADLGDLRRRACLRPDGRAEKGSAAGAHWLDVLVTVPQNGD
jgi:hypothetical protein